MSDRKIYDEEGHAHYLTFSCYRRRRILNDDIHKKIVIGLNPVRAGLVVKPEDWLYSFARWYVLRKSVGVRISPSS